MAQTSVCGLKYCQMKFHRLKSVPLQRLDTLKARVPQSFKPKEQANSFGEEF